MEPLDIICDSCDAHMRLSLTLLERVRGRTGRVTCKKCHQRVALDGRGDTIEVLAGGTVVEVLEFDEEISSVEMDPRLSALPLELTAPTKKQSSLPPPLPEEAAAPSAMQVEPSLLDLADHLRTALDREPLLEAPPPFMRDREDSLSPHTIEDDGDMVSLGREFHSSPFTSERDFTYRSLYPENTRDDVDVPSSRGSTMAERPVKRASFHGSSKALEMDLSVGAPVGDVHVLLGPDGQLLNDADLHPERVSPVPTVSTPASVEKRSGRSRTMIPWAVAAVSLLALGVSLGMPAQSSAPESHLAQAATPHEEPPASTTQSAAPVEEATGAALANSFQQTSDVQEGEEPMQPPAVQAPPEQSVKLVPSSTSETKNAVPTPPPQSSQDLAPPSTDGRHVAEVKLASEEDGKPQASVTLGSATAEAPQGETTEAESPVELPPFSAAAASAALREATALASACRKPTDPQGTATVVVTFAPSGRVTHAVVAGEPYAGTTTGGCIASRFRASRVPAFSGDFVTVKKTVTIQ